MVDFSRAERSKNHRASFFKASENVISFLVKLQDNYKNEWEKLEVIRKERAALIEDTIQLLKKNQIKLGKQLGRCNNEEINRELLNAINSLHGDEREKIQINLIMINNRYEKIQKLGAKLEEIMNTLAHYRVLEDDYAEEVVITIPKKEELAVQAKKEPAKVVEFKQPSERTSRFEKNLDELEKVIDIKEAGKELLADFDATIEQITGKKKKEEPVVDEEIHYFSEKDLFNTNELSSIQDEIDYIISEDLESEIYDEDDKVEEKKEEFILFTLDENTTLKSIAANVYQDEDNWIYLYHYRNNTNKIDRKAAEYDVSVEKVASTPTYLSGVTLEFPTVLIANEEVAKEEQSYRKAVKDAYTDDEITEKIIDFVSEALEDEYDDSIHLRAA